MQREGEGATKRALRRHATVDGTKLQEQMDLARTRQIAAETLHDGTWLLQAARENSNIVSDLTNRPLFPSRSLTWGSCCSGSEGVRFVFEALQLLAAEHGHGITFQHMFSCESAPEKRQWIQLVSEFAGPVMQKIKSCLDGGVEVEDNEDNLIARERSPCLFTDICTLGGSHSECVAHGPNHQGTFNSSGVSEQGRGRCPVPQVDLLVVGTSCKDMSRANNSSSKGRSPPVLLQEKSKGGSAQTFQGMLAFIDAHSPGIVLFENVDAMEDKTGGNSNNLDIALAEMSNRGYESQVIMTDASTMGLPARRRRVYIVFLRVAGNALVDFAQRSMTAMFATLRAAMCVCVRSACCGTEIFLPDDDAAVLSELEVRQQKRARQQELAQKSPPAAQTWMDSHFNFARSIKYRWGEPVPQDLKENPWFRTLTEREQDVLRLCRVQAHQLQRDSTPILFTDVSQSIVRALTPSFDGNDGHHVLPTVLPRMLLWHDQIGRLQLGREALMCQGFPAVPFLNHCESVKRPQAWSPSENLLQDLAGNAMALPVLLGILQSMFVSFSWQGSADIDLADEETKPPRRAVSEEA
ncbi:SSRP1, partial [Symbiodinium natans]